MHKKLHVRAEIFNTSEKKSFFNYFKRINGRCRSKVKCFLTVLYKM